MRDNNLSQHVGMATREDSILDLVLSSDPDLVTSVQVSQTNISDHNILELCTHIENVKTKGKTLGVVSKILLTKYRFKEEHWPSINISLESLDLVYKMEKIDKIDEAYDVLISTFDEVCANTGVPILKNKTGGVKIPKERQKLFKKRVSLTKRLKSCDSHSLRYRSINKQITTIDVLSNPLLNGTN